MSFLHPSATPVVKSRRTKDGGNRNVVVGIARRREPSKLHEDKSLAPTHQHAEHTCNANDKEEKRVTSNPLPSDDVGTTNEQCHKVQQVSHIPLLGDLPSSQPITPVALQQYLDLEQEENVSEQSMKNERLPHQTTQEHTEQLVQKLQEKEQSGRTPTPLQYESGTSQLLDGSHPMRALDLTNIRPKHGPDRETTMIEPAFTYQLRPPFSSSPYDSPAPSYMFHHMHPQSFESIQEFNRFEGFEDRNEEPRFASTNIHYLPEPAVPFNHRATGQMEATHHHPQAFASSNMMQHTYFGHMHEDEELFSVLNQANNVLPRLKALLDQTAVVPAEDELHRSDNLLPGSWPRDVIQEKDYQIKKLTKTIKDLRVQLEESKKIFQNKLDNTLVSLSKMEIDLETSKKREESLNDNLEKLKQEKKEIATRSRQSEVALESFVRWLLQQGAAGHPSQDTINTQTMYFTEQASVDHLEVTAHSTVASSTRSHDAPSNSGLLEGKNVISLDDLIETLSVDEQANTISVPTEATSVEERLSKRSPWLSNALEIAATNACVKLWEEEYARLKYQTEKRHQILIKGHEKEKHDLESSISTSKDRHEKFTQRVRAENMALRQENELLKAQLASQHAWYVQSNIELNEFAMKVDKESQTMRKVLEENLAAANAFSMEKVVR